MIVVSMEREDTTQYYNTKQLYFRRVNVKSNHPLRKTYYKKKKKKKGSVKRGLISIHLI